MARQAEVLYVGIDDTDSLRGGCTTYVTALIVKQLILNGYEIADYPRLVRLNPNIPWKTRGNGSACLKLFIRSSEYDRVRDLILSTVEERSYIGDKGTEPSVVFHFGEPKADIEGFAMKALTDVIRTPEALKLIKASKIEAFSYNGTRGLIGALAAIGNRLDGDHTYELIAYRSKPNWGKPRLIDVQSVLEMDRLTRGSTFNNIDYETMRVLVTPHGPDPVLCGIRGEDPYSVKRAFSTLRIGEEVAGWLIFKTNQGTDAHLVKRYAARDLKPFVPVILEGEVASKPETIQGGHVIFKLKDATGLVDCAAYEPTGNFRGVIKRLIPGDIVRVYGGVRKLSRGKLTVNLEKLEIIKLADYIVYQNPLCPLCGKRMGSMGRGKGFMCDRCGHRARNATKIQQILERGLKAGIYLPPPRAHRHLTKPLSRYGKEKGSSSSALLDGWYFFPT